MKATHKAPPVQELMDSDLPRPIVDLIADLKTPQLQSWIEMQIGFPADQKLQYATTKAMRDIAMTN